MTRKIQKESFVTIFGLLMYLAGIMLKRKYYIPDKIEFWIFFAAYLLGGYSVFKNIAYNVFRKSFFDGNLLIVLATAGTFGIGQYVEAGTVMAVYQIGNLMKLFTVSCSKKKIRKRLDLEEDIEDLPTESEIKGNKSIRNYVFLVLLIAAAILIRSGINTESLEKCFLFFVAASPCAVMMSVPVAFFGGICLAAKRGMIVKGGKYLEILSKADTFIFDKTGTLTEGEFEIQEVNTVEMSREELLEIVTYIESYSNHPIARSLKKLYEKELDQERVTDVQEMPGYGMAAIYEGKQVYIGNARFMKTKAITFQEVGKAGSVIYVAVEGHYAGYLVVSDKIKSNVKEMIQYLKKRCHAITVMVTGDTQFTGKAVAKELELDYYYTNQLPEDKVERLEEFMEMQDKTEYLAAIGDGVNDAPLLAKADVGIVIGRYGADEAIKAADIILQGDDSMAVVDAIRIARETMRGIRQNKIFAVFVKIIVLLMTVLGLLSMQKAVMIEVCVMMITLLNAVWASRDPA